MTEPTEPGWYRTRRASDWMIYSLDEFGRWNAFMLNGDSATNIPFSYIDQAGPIDLIGTYPRKETNAEV